MSVKACEISILCPISYNCNEMSGARKTHKKPQDVSRTITTKQTWPLNCQKASIPFLRAIISQADRAGGRRHELWGPGITPPVSSWPIVKEKKFLFPVRFRSIYEVRHENLHVRLDRLNHHFDRISTGRRTAWDIKVWPLNLETACCVSMYYAIIVIASRTPGGGKSFCLDFFSAANFVGDILSGTIMVVFLLHRVRSG